MAQSHFRAQHTPSPLKVRSAPFAVLALIAITVGGHNQQWPSIPRKCKTILPESPGGVLSSRPMLNLFSATDLKRWVEENRHLYQPPYKTNRILAHYSEFFVLVLNGPNARLDFHREPGEEFFLQIHGDIELHVKPEGERRQVVKIREGEVFLCPGGVAHSPRRGEGTWGLVIERKRKPEETEQFLWFCEHCDEEVLARSVVQTKETSAQVSAIYEEFNANAALRTCKVCGYVFPIAPRAQRLGFLEKDTR